MVAVGILAVAALTFGTALAIRTSAETPAAAAAGSYQDARSSYVDSAIAFDSAQARLSSSLEMELVTLDELRSAMTAAVPGIDVSAMALLGVELDRYDEELGALVSKLPAARTYGPPTLAADAPLADVASAVDEVLAEQVRLSEDERLMDSLWTRFRSSRSALVASLSEFGETLVGSAQSVVGAAPARVTQDWRDAFAVAAASAKAGLTSTSRAVSALQAYASSLTAFQAEAARAKAEADAEAQAQAEEQESSWWEPPVEDSAPPPEPELEPEPEPTEP